jgi:hypothetical protein
VIQSAQTRSPFAVASHIVLSLKVPVGCVSPNHADFSFGFPSNLVLASFVPVTRLYSGCQPSGLILASSSPGQHGRSRPEIHVQVPACTSCHVRDDQCMESVYSSPSTSLITVFIQNMCSFEAGPLRFFSYYPCRYKDPPNAPTSKRTHNATSFAHST